MKGYLRHLKRPVLAAVLVGLLSPCTILAAVPLGQVSSAGSQVDGIPAPAGTTLLSPALIEAGEMPAIVHLSNGRALALRPGTSALLRDSDGGVAVEVQSGLLALGDGSGEVVTLASNGLLVLDEQGEIQEGTRVEELVKLCQLEDSTPEKFQLCTQDDPDAEGCEWEPLEVPPAEAEKRIGVDCVYAGKDNNVLELDLDCQGELAPVVVAAGLSDAQRLGLVLGGMVGGSYLYQELDPDDNPVVSPIRP